MTKKEIRQNMIKVLKSISEDNRLEAETALQRTP